MGRGLCSSIFALDTGGRTPIRSRTHVLTRSVDREQYGTKTGLYLLVRTELEGYGPRWDHRRIAFAD